MHRIHQNFGMLGIGMLVDAVAEIEHMAAALAISRQNARGFSAYAFGRAKQRKRVEIALQRYFIAHAAARLAGSVSR